MNILKKILISFLLIFNVLFSCSIKKINAESEFCTNAKSAILISTTNNTVLYEKNKDERLPIASMTKVMTLALIYDAIKDNRISMDDILTTSAHAKSMGGSQVYLEEGEKSKLKDLIKCICIASANDAAVTVAEYVYGSESMFVNEMNKKASSLGMKNTFYSDVTGLSDENHYSSAHDMAIISSYLVETHPEVLEYTSMKESYFREDTDKPFWLVNTNKLIGSDSIDGLKTGWTNKAGYCISATKKENGMRLITVVMGYENPIKRNSEAKELLNYGSKNYMVKSFISPTDIIIRKESILYRNGYVEYVASKEIDVVMKKSEEENYQIRNNYDSKNPDGGYIELYYNEEMIEKSEIFKNNSKKRNIFELLINIINKVIL